MKRVLVCLLILIGFLIAGCEEEEKEHRDARLRDGSNQFEVTVQPQ